VSSSPWKTGAPVTRSKPTVRPGLVLVLRQLLIAALIAVLWGAMLAGYTQIVGVQAPTPAAAPAPRAAQTRSPGVAPTAVAAVPPPAAATLPRALPTAAAAATAALVPATNTPAATRPAATATAAPQAGAVSFSKDVLPILQSVCVKCHGGERTDASLTLKSFADVMAGSRNGPVVDPGKSGNSLLIELINNGEMPKRAPKLLPAQIRIITQWVDAGAPNN
jgi:mono/diheme cytochrome c family protein